ncbi:hypothetical protein PAMP_011848 [Pampus punctatissimus]
MTKGSECASSGGGRRRRRRHRRRVLVLSIATPTPPDIIERGTTGTEERKSEQTGRSRREELRAFSGAQLLDVAETTQVSATRPKVRCCFSCRLAWNKHLARSRDRPLAMPSVR